MAHISELLREAGGVINIEDLLPLFPDFVAIDRFKAAITAALEDYNTQIDQLKQEMHDATRVADALRKDLAMLDQRTATLDVSQPCAACGLALASPPPPSAGATGGSMPRFFLFPTGNAYHAACCVAKTLPLVSPQQAQRIRLLVKRLSLVPEGREMAPDFRGQGSARVEDLRVQLENETGAADPLCSELLLPLLSRPFVGEDDDETISWRL